MKFGSEILLDDLLVRLSADCPWRDEPRGGLSFPPREVERRQSLKEAVSFASSGGKPMLLDRGKRRHHIRPAPWSRRTAGSGCACAKRAASAVKCRATISRNLPARLHRGHRPRRSPQGSAVAHDLLDDRPAHANHLPIQRLSDDRPPRSATAHLMRRSPQASSVRSSPMPASKRANGPNSTGSTSASSHAASIGPPEN